VNSGNPASGWLGDDLIKILGDVVDPAFMPWRCLQNVHGLILRRSSSWQIENWC